MPKKHWWRLNCGSAEDKLEWSHVKKDIDKETFLIYDTKDKWTETTRIKKKVDQKTEKSNPKSRRGWTDCGYACSCVFNQHSHGSKYIRKPSISWCFWMEANEAAINVTVKVFSPVTSFTRFHPNCHKRMSPGSLRVSSNIKGCFPLSIYVSMTQYEARLCAHVQVCLTDIKRNL